MSFTIPWGIVGIRTTGRVFVPKELLGLNTLVVLIEVSFSSISIFCWKLRVIHAAFFFTKVIPGVSRPHAKATHAMTIV